MVRRNAWAANAIESFIGNAAGTGIKPHFRHLDAEVKRRPPELWLRWTDEADAAGLTDFYGLQALVCPTAVEGGECIVRLRERRPENRLAVPLQLQLLETEHLPMRGREPAERQRDLRREGGGQSRLLNDATEFISLKPQTSRCGTMAAEASGTRCKFLGHQRLRSSSNA